MRCAARVCPGSKVEDTTGIVAEQRVAATFGYAIQFAPQNALADFRRRNGCQSAKAAADLCLVERCWLFARESGDEPVDVIALAERVRRLAEAVHRPGFSWL